VPEKASAVVLSPEPQPLAFDINEALARVDGDKELLCEMAELFLEEYPRFLSQIREAVANQDPQTLAYAAHTLKGSAGNFAAASTFEAALALERMGRQGDVSHAPAALAQLETALAKLTPALSGLKP
jgi:HPt (histidine-containing phosphotransfer) domain-containing protein